MRLIIIYGAEASGKLTVARALSDKVGFAVFHNHLSIDVAKTLFAYGEPEYDELVWKVRRAVFEAASKNAVPGLIFTWAYSHPDFQPYLDQIYGCMDPHGDTISFVHLSCSQAALEQRVVGADRARAGKIDTVPVLRAQQRRKNHAVIPGSRSLEIDNTASAPSAVAGQIIDHYNLAVQPLSR